MEYLSTILFFVFYWLFLRSLIAGHKGRIEEFAGKLLLELPVKGAGRMRGVRSVMVSVYFGFWMFVGLPHYPAVMMNEQLWLGGRVFQLTTITLSLLLMIAVACSSQRIRFYEKGLAMPSFLIFKLVPWGGIYRCEWGRPPGALHLQYQLMRATYEFSPKVLDQAVAFVSQRVPTSRPVDSSLLENLPEEVRAALDRPVIEDPDAPTDPITRFVWPQFSLRSLLLLMLTVSAAFSWVGVQMHRRRAEERLLAPLQHAHPEVDWWGTNVVGLNFRNSSISDDDLPHVVRFKHLETLTLGNAPITDGGLEHLHNATSLEDLYFGQTEVTPAGIEKLKHVLPALNIHD